MDKLQQEVTAGRDRCF